MIISSSIISINFLSLEQELKLTEQAGIDWLHIDVMDGQFVPNITIGPLFLPFCKKVTKIPLDVHLMIKQPENHIEAFSNAGADLSASTLRIIQMFCVRFNKSKN